MNRLIAVAVGLALGTGIALADSPHFIRAEGVINGLTGTVDCSWKEAGLGDNLQILYTCGTQTASATYVCVNKGGANPSAQNKTTVQGPVLAAGAFSSGKNGQITASLTLLPPGPGEFSCPNGQRLDLAAAAFIDVVLTDTTNNVTELLGNFSTGCLLPEIRGAC